MNSVVNADICIIGAGSGGLSLAAGAAQLGRKVVLIEKHKMGGDCLNYGCVPSKSLIAAAKHAHAVRRAPEFGVDAGQPKTDQKRVVAHVREVIAAIEPNDSVERFEKLGVRVIKAAARFLSSTEVEAGEVRVRAKYFVVATGSRALVPPIKGLDATPFFTNETIFDNEGLPEHLIVIGGGPIGLEMAQAHRRLGSRVTVLEGRVILPKDDSEAVDVVRRVLSAEGIHIVEGANVTSATRTAHGVRVEVTRDGKTEIVEGSHLLLAAGRTPNVDGLNLEAAGVTYSRRGIEVDAGLRTSSSRIFAIGDVAGGLQFTHVAGYHASVLVRRLVFNLPAKTDLRAVPWCTYVDPELAHTGLTEAEAKSRGLKVSISRWPLHDNDRAQAERETEGFAKIVISGGRVVGATIVGPHAGDLILPWVLAISQRTKLSAIAGLIAPYPTLGEISKRAASAHFTPALFSARTRFVVRLLNLFG